MGIPATGRKIRFDIHAHTRFVDGKIGERWDRCPYCDVPVPKKGRVCVHCDRVLG